MTGRLIELRMRPSAAHAREHNMSRAWERVGVHSPAEVDRGRHRIATAYGRGYEVRQREVNSTAASLVHHHIPTRTVMLGWALELETVFGDDELGLVTKFEPREFVVLTDARAEQMRAGMAGLYLVRVDKEEGDPGIRAAERETFAAWHKREPDKAFNLDAPELCGFYHGLALRIDYASDKWREPGDAEEYTHDFSESGLEPEVWADSYELADARALVIRGGDMRVTAAGID